MTSSERDVVKAEVTGFSPNGRIAFTATDDYGTVTFEISSDVWSGNGPPQKGEIVILSEMKRFRKGWRAAKARRFVLTDESRNPV